MKNLPDERGGGCLLLGEKNEGEDFILCGQIYQIPNLICFSPLHLKLPALFQTEARDREVKGIEH